MTRIRLIAALALVALLPGCATVVGQQPGTLPPTLPPQPIGAEPADGAIFQQSTAITLFSDVAAHRVGDLLTIVLDERTQASKSASTEAAKDSSFDSGSPTLLGRTITRNGTEILNNAWQTQQDFQGEGSSSQSNSLDGSITVTVAQVFPNGNLLVRGEKWLTLNQGEEYVQITGIVRPTDVAPDNSVPSFKVADARITYSGNGTVANASRPGLLTRFFLKAWPL